VAKLIDEIQKKTPRHDNNQGFITAANSLRVGKRIRRQIAVRYPLYGFWESAIRLHEFFHGAPGVLKRNEKSYRERRIMQTVN